MSLIRQVITKSNKGIFLLFFSILVSGVVSGQEEIKGALAPKPLFRDPVYDGAADPTIIWNRGEKKWFMFYTNRRATDTINGGVSWVHGTVNSGDPNYARTILNDKEASKYIKGLGVQWDMKYAIATINKEFPNLSKMQTESECGNGERNWKSAEYTWSLINTYLSNGANSYMYWNMILDPSGASTWGWKQNAMITIDKKTKEVIYNPEYYLMKHLSHYVLPGANRLETSGGKDHLAFVNPNGEVVLLVMNQDENDKLITLAMNNKKVSLKLKAKSINTFTF